MNDNALLDLQASVQDKNAFRSLNDYADLCQTFLDFVNETKLTRVVSPSHSHYIFTSMMRSIIIKSPAL